MNLSLSLVYDQLNAVAQSPDYWTILNTAFGINYNTTLAATLQQQWQTGDFSALPPIQILSSEVLGNASGAYAASNNTIYLADSFVATATPEALSAVILEEIGHFVDAQINTVDTQGDEGELFSDLVRGITPTATELNRLGVNVGGNAAPFLQDIDGDRDLDLIVGRADGTLSYYKNTGTATAPVYTAQTGTANPFNSIDSGNNSTPTLAKVDQDILFDLVVGSCSKPVEKSNNK
jgi:hypothetical protein